MTDIEVDRAAAVTITFDDGVRARYELAELRIESAELVGAWGISFSWSDGHTTGIYSWDLLRAWRDLNDA